MGKEFLHDLNIHGAGQIQFKNTAGTNAGKIDQNGNDLVLSNSVGDIIIGNGSDDVFIGDGTNTVDIRFEQNMAIFADSSSTRTLTLGGANTSLVLESPTISGSFSLSGATTINNKLTLASSNGYIVFDYEPSTGSNAEYSSEVPLLKVDHAGTEKTILSRLTNNGALAIGIDDTVAIVAGDTKSVIQANHNYAAENIIFASEGGFIAYGFPNNDTTWSNRNEFRFRSDSSTASDNGLYIGDDGNTQFIDVNRNLRNINSIRSNNNIPFLTLTGSAQKIRVSSLYAGTTYANDGSSAGEVDALNGYRVAGTSVIDSSRNLANIGTITASGKLTINTGSDDILTLNQTSTDTKWNYINFNNQGTREWFIGQDSDGNFDLYNDNINAYAITVSLSDNSIVLNDNVNVAGNLVLNSNSNIVAARKFTARDGNGVMLTADDATSGLSIADNGNATFSGSITGSGNATFGSDTNTQLIAGRAKIGAYVDDYVYFSHIDYGTSSNYALKQSPTGNTELNAKTGGTVQLSINNSPKLTLVGDSIGIGTGSPSRKLAIAQSADANGLQILGHDDKSTSGIELNVDASGHARLSQTTDGSSGYLFLQAENYLQLIAGTFTYTQNPFRIYDNTQLQFGNSADYKISHISNSDILVIHTDDNKGITIDNAGNTTFSDNVTIEGNLNITGDINSTSVNNLDVVDKLITLGKGQTEASSNGSGIFVDGSSASLLWDETNNTWDFNKSLDVVGNINASGSITSTGITISTNNPILTFSDSSDSQHDWQTRYRDNIYEFIWGGGIKYYFKNTHELRFGDRDAGQLTNANIRDPFIRKSGSTTINSVAIGHLQLGTNNTTQLTIDAAGDATFASKVIIPQTATTIGGSNLGNASLLLGSTTTGIGIDTNEIVSKGDHLYIGAATDGKNIIFRTDATSAVLTLDSSQNAHFAGVVNIPSKLQHTGDSDTFLNFSDDTITLSAGGTSTTFAGSGAATFAGDILVNTATSGGYIQIDHSDDSFKLADANKIKIGTGNDLQIFHNGSNSFITNFTGNLTITNETNDGDISFKSDDGSGGFTEYFRLDGGVGYMIASKAFRFLDTVNVQLGNSADFTMQHNATNTELVNVTGNLNIKNSATDGDIGFYADNGSGGTTEYFKVDGGAEQVIFSKEIKMLDNTHIKIGSGGDLRISHDGTDSIISNNTGDLLIQNNANDKDIIFKSDNGSGGVAEYMRLDGSQVTIRMKRQVKWDDNIKATFGDSDDLQIYHDGSNSYINDTGTGSLILKGNSIKVNDDGDGNALFQVDASGDIGLKVETGLANYIFGDSAALGSGNFLEISGGDSFDFKYFEGGVGTFTKFQINPAGGFTRHKDNVIANFGDGNDLQIYHAAAGIGGNSIIDNATGDILIRNTADNRSISILTDNGSGSTTTYVKANGLSGATELYHYGSNKFATTATGISVTGDISISGDIKGRKVPIVIHGSFDDTTSSTSNLIIPLAGSITETTVSGGYAPHFFTIPYACVLKKVIMKTVSGSMSSSFTTELKAYKNGTVTGNSSSGELTHSNSSVTWNPTAHSDITYAAGDKFSLVYQKSATSKYWQDVAVTIVFTLTGYDI